MSKTVMGSIMLVISIVAFYIYFTNRLPGDLELKGNEAIVPLISLVTAIVSLLATILAFLMKVMELKAGQVKKE